MFGFHFKTSALSLLKEAADLYDSGRLDYFPHKSFWRNDFSMGARWMHACLSTIRGSQVIFPERVNFNGLGMLKNGVATAVSFFVWGIGVYYKSLPLILLATFAFYLVEVQMVFLFPLLIDKDPRPFGTSRLLIVKGGGTIRAMSVVMPISAYMMLGGLCGRGFVRSWCVGCLAVLLWYRKALEEHRQ